jgi:hypothetical protein
MRPFPKAWLYLGCALGIISSAESPLHKASANGYVLRQSQADEGCRIIREKPMLDPMMSVETWRSMKADLRKKGLDPLKYYGLSKARLGAGDDELPMGFVLSKDQKKIHINCFLCHGETIHGVPTEGAATFRLKFERLGRDVDAKEPNSNLRMFWASGGKLGENDHFGATYAFALTQFAEMHRDDKGNVDLTKVAKEVIKGKGDPVALVPVYPPAWWLTAIKRQTIYTGGNANQNAAHLMQFAHASFRVTPDDLKAEYVGDFQKILACVKSKKAPALPDSMKIDVVKATRGRDLYHGKMEGMGSKCNCASCHGGVDPVTGSYEYPEEKIDVSEIGTDNSYSKLPKTFWNKHEKLCKEINCHAEVYEQMGYVAPPLSGLWARGGLLHNRSVPTVHNLLQDPASRPKKWAWKDSENPNVLDASAVITEARAEESYDTTQAGFSNSGHNHCTQYYKAHPEEVANLVEYLKTQ